MEGSGKAEFFSSQIRSNTVPAFNEPLPTNSSSFFSSSPPSSPPFDPSPNYPSLFTSSSSPSSAATSPPLTPPDYFSASTPLPDRRLTSSPVSRLPKGVVERPNLNTYTSFEEFLGEGCGYYGGGEETEEEGKVEKKEGVMRRMWFGMKV